MKKSNILLLTIALSIMVMLSACERDNADTNTNPNTNQNSNEQGLPQEQDNADTNTNPNTNQNTNEQDLPQEQDNADNNTHQNNNGQSVPQEQLAGTLQAIDGMKLTVDTSQVFMSFGGEQRVEPGAPAEKQDTIVRLTEQTAIEVRTVSSGQPIGTRAGTLDDLSIQNVVLVEGEWQGDEFIAINLIIFNY